MKFIKLTTVADNKPVWVNAELVIRVYQKIFTAVDKKVWVSQVEFADPGLYAAVLETPEEIMRLIKSTKEVPTENGTPDPGPR